MTPQLRGVLTALTTPFDSEENIDGTALRKVIDRSIDHGVAGVVAGGSTGDFASLSADERRFLVDTVVEHTGGRVPVIAQTGAMTTREAIRHSRAAQRSGADVLMLVTPYYEPLTTGEVIAYITEVAENVDLPVMLYNIPGATGFNLGPDTVTQLAGDLENVRYIKDSSADWDQNLRLIHELGDLVDTFVGWDPFIRSALIEGAAGVMAGTANVLPGPIVSVHRLIQAGDLLGAATEWSALYPAIQAMTSLPFNAAVKAGLRLQGIPVGAPLRPAAGLTDSELAKLHDALTPFSERENA